MEIIANFISILVTTNISICRYFFLFFCFENNYTLIKLTYSLSLDLHFGAFKTKKHVLSHIQKSILTLEGPTAPLWRKSTLSVYKNIFNW